MCTRGLPDIYTLSPRACSPRASGVYIRQTTRAHGITTKYIYIYTIYIYIYILYIYILYIYILYIYIYYIYISGVEEAIPHWSGKNTNRNVSLGGLGACLPGKFMP